MTGETIDAEVTESALALTHETMPVPGMQSVVAPIISPEDARRRWDAYLALSSAILDRSDYEKAGDKLFKKKSAVKKLQTFFGFSIDVLRIERDDLGEGYYGMRVVARATAPNGRYVDATGGCSTTEERFDLQRYGDESDERYEKRVRKANARAYHDVLSTAETRATNRAAMNLIGAGEVTADEMRNIGKPPMQSAESAEPRLNARRTTPEEYRERLRKRVMVLCRDLEISDDYRHRECATRYGQTSTNKLTAEQLIDYGTYLANLAILAEESA